MQDERQQHQQLQPPNQQQQQNIAQDLIVSNHTPLDMSFTMLDNSVASSFSMPQSAPVDMQHIMWDGSTPFLTDTSIFGTGGDMEAMSAGALDDFDSWMRSQEGQFATPNPNQALGPSPSLSFGPLGGDQNQLQQTHSTQSQTGHPQVQKTDTDIQTKPARKERPLAPKPAAASFADSSLAGPAAAAAAAAAAARERAVDGRGSGIAGLQEPEHWQHRPATTETIAGSAHVDTDPANLLDPSQVNRKNHRRNRSSLDAAKIFVPSSSSPLGKTPAGAGGSTDLSSLRMVQRLQNRKGKAYHRGASPEKSNLRPGLSRSMSENRVARNGRGPASLSSGRRLPYSVSSNGSIVEVNRTSVSGGSARGGRSGRISPLKHQKRLSELASVREIPQFQEKIRLAVNERGFAHPELILSTGQLPQPDEGSSSESESDESDDEPIMLPSRNSSFALKDSRKPVGGLYHSSKRSLGGSSSSNTNMEVDLGLIGDVHDDSDAETVTEGKSGMGGDASSALKDLAFQRGQQRLRGSLSARQARSFHDPFENPPLSLTLDEEPFRETAGSLVRCVCQRDSRGSEAGAGSFMVQCQCCENWLHGNCINITRTTRPSVYICAFCADTGFGRGTSRQSTGLPRTQGIASSPLTKKSIRSFR